MIPLQLKASVYIHVRNGSISVSTRESAATLNCIVCSIALHSVRAPISAPWDWRRNRKNNVIREINPKTANVVRHSALTRQSSRMYVTHLLYYDATITHLSKLISWSDNSQLEHKASQFFSPTRRFVCSTIRIPLSRRLWRQEWLRRPCC